MNAKPTGEPPEEWRSTPLWAMGLNLSICATFDQNAVINAGQLSDYLADPVSSWIPERVREVCMVELRRLLSTEGGAR